MKMTKKKRKNLNKKKIRKKARILKIQPTKKKPQKMMKTFFWEKKLPLALSLLVKKNKKLSILKKEAPTLILIITLYLKLHLKKLWTISQKKGNIQLQ